MFLEILWSHVQSLYHRDSGAMKIAGGLSLVPKLTYEHIYLTSFSKMRVDLAAQVCCTLSKQLFETALFVTNRS